MPGKEISVLGFDNLGDARTMRISSYDFHFDHVAEKAMAWILNPSVFPLGKGDTYIECEGSIHQRISTGKSAFR